MWEDIILLSTLVIGGWVAAVVIVCVMIRLFLVLYGRGGMSETAKQTYLTGIMSLFHEGGIAADRNLEEQSNPYPDPGPENRAWHFGWRVRQRQICEVAEAVERVVRTSRQELDRLRVAHEIDSKAVQEDEMDPVTAEALVAFKRLGERSGDLPSPVIDAAHFVSGMPLAHLPPGTPVDAAIKYGQFGDDYSAEPCDCGACDPSTLEIARQHDEAMSRLGR